MALTDTLDDLISDERINPQLAMKILGNFDQAITEALQKEVKSRLTFKVSLPPILQTSPAGSPPPTRPVFLQWRRCYMGNGADVGFPRVGKSGHLPILRRGLDLFDTQRRVQDGRVEPDGLGGQGQDCQLQREEARRDLVET